MMSLDAYSQLKFGALGSLFYKILPLQIPGRCQKNGLLFGINLLTQHLKLP